MNKSKKYNLALLATSLLICAIGYLFLAQYCVTGSCDYDIRNNLLRPALIGSISLAGFFSVFLLLPAPYFKKWLKYVFSWGFPMVVYLTYITTGSSSIPAYGKVEVVKFWGMAFAGITIIFIAVQVYLDRKQKKNK